MQLRIRESEEIRNYIIRDTVVLPPSPQIIVSAKPKVDLGSKSLKRSIQPIALLDFHANRSRR